MKVETLRKSEVETRAILAALPDLVFRLSRDGVHLDFHASRLDDLFVQPDVFLGKGVSEVLPADVAERYQVHILQALDNEQIQIFEYQLDFVEKGRQDYEARMVPYGEHEVLVVVRNITERKQAEETLRESEERFRQLAENIHEVFWMTDPQTTQILYVSPAYEQIWGRTCQSLYEQPTSYMDPIHPEDRNHVAATLGDTAAGKPIDVEYRITRHDGTIRWIRSRTFPIRDEGGQIYRIAGISEDVTARKHAEELLRQEQQKAQMYLEIAPSIILALDVYGCITLINEQGCRILECERDEIIGRNWFDTFLPANVREIVKDVFDQLMAGEVEPVEYFENNVLTGKGNERTVLWHNTVIRDEAGRIVGTLTAAEDITDRKRVEDDLRRSEAMLKEAQQLAHIGHWFWDIAADNLSWSEEIFRIFGVDPQTFSVTAENFERAVHPDDLAPFLEARGQMLAEETEAEIGHRIVRPGGEVRYVLERARVLRDSTGEAAYVMGTVQDITERKQAEDALRVAYEELQQTQAQLVQSAKMAAVGTLAAGVAHEINNPMTAVLGFAELLLRDANPDDPNYADLVDIVAGARRVRDVVRGLLAFSRQTPPYREQVNINQIVQDTLSLVRQQLETSGVALEERYAPDLPALWLDVGQVRQVVLNLVTNAIQATSRGDRLTVSTARVGDEVTLRVADTGAGISPEDLARVFEPFFTTKPLGQGTGLGLSVSRSIVQEHDGRIAVESQVGQGSTFTVWLPFATTGGSGHQDPDSGRQSPQSE